MQISEINKYNHKKSILPWITQGLLNSIRYRDKLYKQMRLSNPSSPHYNTLNINLKTYNLILKKSIMSVKQMYYESCFNRYGNDILSTWKTINEILTKNQTQKKCPTIFQENGLTISDRVGLNISNNFNVFFTNNGEKMLTVLIMLATKTTTSVLSK